MFGHVIMQAYVLSRSHASICFTTVIDRTGQGVELRHGATLTRFKKFPKHLKKVRPSILLNITERIIETFENIEVS